MALRALQGAGRRQVAGRIVKAEPFLLTVEVEVERLEADEPAAASLGEWAYSGPVMHESEAMDDVKHGRVYHYDSLKDFYKEMGL